MTQEVVALGMVTYDQTRLAQLSLRVSGTVWSVQKNVGQPIKKNELLAIIEAREVGQVKAEFLQAVVDAELKTLTLERMESVPNAMSERRIREAEADEREARIRLFNSQQTLVNLGLPIRLEDVANLHDEELVRRVHFLGLPDSVVKKLDPETTTANLIPLLAPFDGVVIGREIVTGELVDPSSGAQIVVADVTHMWIELDVRKEDSSKIRRGQEVIFTVDGMPGEYPQRDLGGSAPRSTAALARCKLGWRSRIPWVRRFRHRPGRAATAARRHVRHGEDPDPRQA